jgi:Ca-activated chloride channel family protein
MQAPLVLLGLLVLPGLLLLWWWTSRRRSRDLVCFSNLEVLAPVVGAQRASYRRWLPGALLFAALASLVLAVARPQLRVSGGVSFSTVVFVVDSAGSMAEKDLGPSRLRIAKRVALGLLGRLDRRTRVGLVALESDEPEGPDAGQAPIASDDPQVRVAPTSGRAFPRAMIDGLSLGYPSESGDGLAAALALITDPRVRTPRRSGLRIDWAGRPNARIELLTDGQDATGGALSLRVARQARRLRVAIDTITLNRSASGADTPPVPEASTLGQIARLSRGQSLTLTNYAQLPNLNQQLAVGVTRTQTRRQLMGFLVAAGAGLIGSASILALLWRPRLP